MPEKRILVAALLAGLAIGVGGAVGSAALRVTITQAPPSTSTSLNATFAWTASETATFTCSLDGARPAGCSSPESYSAVGEGVHSFTVVASNTDRAGRTYTARDQHRWTVDLPDAQPQPTPPPKPQPPGDTAPPPPPPCGGSAVDTVSAPELVFICFDDLSPGTEVQSHYKAKGVEFGYTKTDQLGKTPVFPRIAASPEAWSDGQLAKSPPCGGEFCMNTFHGRFTHEHKLVQVRAGGSIPVRLVAYSVTGAKVGEQIKNVGPAAATTLKVEMPAPMIAYFEIGENTVATQQYGDLKIDDLAFDPPDPSLKPDFGLAWQPQSFDGTLGVSKGSSSVATIYVNRFNGSTGNIKLSVDPQTLPSGVSAAFDPSIVGTSTKTTKLKVTATAGAATVKGKKLTVVGKPLVATAGSNDRTLKIPLLILLSDYDLKATGIEVTQGIQRQLSGYYNASSLSSTGCQVNASLPYGDVQIANDPVPYWSLVPTLQDYGMQPPFGESKEPTSVTLIAGRKTVVRGFAAVDKPLGGKVGDVPALLIGKKNGQPLPGSPLSPDDGTHDLSWRLMDWVTCVHRADPKGAYTFTLPESWTHGAITLRLKVTPDEGIIGPGGECGNPACVANNQFSLTDVAFKPPVHVTVTPVAMQYTAGADATLFGPPAPWKVFGTAFYVTPAVVSYAGGAWDGGYAGWIGITDELNDYDVSDEEEKDDLCSELLDKLEDWADEHAHGNATLGVFTSDSAVCNGVSDGSSTIEDDGESFGVAAANRPFTSVAHELFHGYGAPHYGNDPACYPDEDDLGIKWPPDGRGHIHGIGLDTRPGSGNGNGPYRVLVPKPLLSGALAQGQKAEWIDFMSYCASESNSWISDRGWEKTLDDLDDLPNAAFALRRLTESQAASLRVTALADSAGARILTVKPGASNALQGGPSPYRLIVRNAVGAVIDDVAMSSSATSSHRAEPNLLLRAESQAIGAASVEILRDGRVLDRRVRSLGVPAVQVTSPRRGERVGVASAVVVRWHATDADGGELEAKVDYSRDDGRTWRTLFVGPEAGSVRLPAALLSASARARMRVRVSDGFNVGSATSDRFTAIGRPPAVRIVNPAPGGRLRADAALYLEGRAYDDRGQPVPGRNLLWYAGPRKLGHGSHVSARLPAGRQMIRLVARDRRGRIGSASVRVRVLAVVPHVLTIKAPRLLSRRARALAFSIATTIPATLHVNGRRYKVDRAPTRVVVPIRPGPGPVRITLRLTAGGKALRTTLVVPRR